jgi:hypothetical protein
LRKSYNIRENHPNYPICIKLAARTLFKINKIEFSSKFLLFGLAHINNKKWLFVNWAAKFIDGQQNYLFEQQKIYFFGQPLS